METQLTCLQLFCQSKIAFLLSIYLGVVYGLLYLLFATITVVFTETYGWSIEIAGLSFLGIGLGQLLAIVVVGATSDKLVKKLTVANNNQFEPEMRLAPVLWFSCLIPASFFIYGWCTDKAVFWLVPVIGLFPFGVGFVGVFALITTYMIDAFTEYAASAIACLTLARCAIGAVLPLVAPSMCMCS